MTRRRRSRLKSLIASSVSSALTWWLASEQTGLTADTALRLAKALGTSAQLWLNLQNDYDVQIAKRDLGKDSRSEGDLGNAHLLEQRQIVLDVPVVRDAAVLRLDEVGGDEGDGLAVALDLAEGAGEVAGEAHVH